MKLDAKVLAIREAASRSGRPAVPAVLQGVTRERVQAVLARISRATIDEIDAVVALLDNTQPSWYPAVAASRTFADGAGTAHLACHIGILQRGKSRLDREGRDYWIKPLRSLGAIEPVTLVHGKFVPGHVIAKSPASAYRLAESFKAILQAPEGEWQTQLAAWIEQDVTRERMAHHVQDVSVSRTIVSSPHRDLIQAAVAQYVPRFLDGYEVLYTDAEDGDRVTAEQKTALAAANIHLGLGDAMPDVLLWSRANESLWVIEAVTSDGEVDLHKVRQLTALAERAGKKRIQFTTAYRSWKAAASRQGTHRNIAPETYIWIQEDPTKQLMVIAG